MLVWGGTRQGSERRILQRRKNHPIALKRSGRTSVIIVRINSIDQSVKTVQMKFTNEKKFLDDSETVGKAEE